MLCRWITTNERGYTSCLRSAVCKFCNLSPSWSRRGMAVGVSLRTPDSIHSKQGMPWWVCSYPNTQVWPMRKCLQLASNTTLHPVDNSCNLVLFLWTWLNTVMEYFHLPIRNNWAFAFFQAAPPGPQVLPHPPTPVLNQTWGLSLCDLIIHPPSSQFPIQIWSVPWLHLS